MYSYLYSLITTDFYLFIIFSLTTIFIHKCVSLLVIVAVTRGSWCESLTSRRHVRTTERWSVECNRNRSWLQLRESVWLEGGTFWWMHYAHEPKTDKLTLMVGVMLPGRDLLSRSLRELLSSATGGWSCSWCLSSYREGEWKRTFTGLIHDQRCCCCMRVLSRGGTCLLSCLMPHRWHTQHPVRGHFKNFNFLLPYDHKWVVRILVPINMRKFQELLRFTLAEDFVPWQLIADGSFQQACLVWIRKIISVIEIIFLDFCLY